MDVPFQRAWLSWVGATTACLRAQGVSCDQTDVAGMSGYAFLLNIHESLCPSGPTSFDWGGLLGGIRLLGRSTLTYNGGQCGGNKEQARYCFDFVEQQLKTGRPCVLWGAYLPEFAVAVGVENGSYLVRSYRETMPRPQPQPPVPWDQLVTPGCVYALSFPTTAVTARAAADRRAVSYAVDLMRRRSSNRTYTCGLDAYDQWIAALHHTDHVDVHGCAYNAQCWAEARSFARDFIKRVRDRDPIMAEPLAEAHHALSDSAAALWKVAQLFPFPPAGQLTDDARRQASQALSQAKAADAQAIEALAHAAEG
jgi:hypothetical protein